MNRVAIAGVGFSQTGRRLDLTDNEMVRQAVSAAMADAGMTPADIDGVGTMGGNALSIAHLMGMTPVNYFFTSSMMAPAFVEPAIMSMSAVASGVCHTCVAVRLIRRQPGQADILASRGTGPMKVGGDMQFSAPFGAGAAASLIAGLQMQRYLSEFGATEEQFAVNAVTQRYHASLNEDALFREPMTVDDYMNARYISKPVRLLDCDYPCDSGVGGDLHDRRAGEGLAEAAGDGRVVRACPRSATSTWRCSTTTCGTRRCTARMRCGRAPISPPPTSTAHSSTTASPSSPSSGSRRSASAASAKRARSSATAIPASAASMPLNTDGGACNVGRRHGANFCIEATRQLRGECGERQVPNAEVAVWSNAVGCFAGAALLTR